MSGLIEIFLTGGIIGGGAYLLMLWYDRNDKDSGETYDSPHTPFLNLIRSSLTQKEDNPFNKGNIAEEDEFTAEELKELDDGIDADYELKEPDQMSEDFKKFLADKNISLNDFKKHPTAWVNEYERWLKNKI